MKAILRHYGYRTNQEQRYALRTQAADLVRTRGTSRKPAPPREIILQSGPRGVLLSWSLPAGMFTDISGWRVYKDNESTLYAELKDRGARQHFIEATSGATPPTGNFFISSVNLFGVESQKVQVQGKSTVESGAPPMPPSPPGYTQGDAGGGNTSTGSKDKQTL